MVMSQNMRLYSLNKLLLNPLMIRPLGLNSVSLRFALIAMITSGGVAFNLSAYAADEIETPTPTATDLNSLPFANAPPKNDIEVVNRPLIAGLWRMTIPNVKCIEYYNFRENGEFLVKSAGEWSMGKYVYQLPNMEDMATSLPQLTMGIQYDSNDEDCSGNKVNQTGEVQQEYVKWISPSRIKFCATTDGQQCPLELDKVLP
jgi:hypothetical protein